MELVTVAPEPISVGVALSGAIVLVSAIALARALGRPGGVHDGLSSRITIPACGILLGLMGLALSTLPLAP